MWEQMVTLWLSACNQVNHTKVEIMISFLLCKVEISWSIENVRSLQMGLHVSLPFISGSSLHQQSIDTYMYSMCLYVTVQELITQINTLGHKPCTLNYTSIVQSPQYFTET